MRLRLIGGKVSTGAVKWSSTSDMQEAPLLKIKVGQLLWVPAAQGQARQ